MCPVDDVGYVEVLRVVARDDVWVHFLDEVPPLLEQLLFVFERVDSCTHDWRALVEGKDITNKWLFLAVHFDNVGNLDNWVYIWSWELALGCRALNVEGQDSQGRNLGVYFERYGLSIAEV